MARKMPLSADDLRLARMLKALGNPTRLQMVAFMASHPTCITRQIVEATPLAQATVSQHLKVLRDAGLIRGEIEGPATCYCLDPEGLHWLEARFGAWAQRQAACCPAPEADARAEEGP